MMLWSGAAGGAPLWAFDSGLVLPWAPRPLRPTSLRSARVLSGPPRWDTDPRGLARPPLGCAHVPHTFLWDEGSARLLPVPLCAAVGFILSCPSPAPGCLPPLGPGMVPGHPGPQDGHRPSGPAAHPPHTHSLAAQLCGARARGGRAGGHPAGPVSPGGREPASAASCPARARSVCCLPTVPLCPQGRRRWKAHHARGRAPALTLALPALPATSGCFSPFVLAQGP